MSRLRRIAEDSRKKQKWDRSTSTVSEESEKALDSINWSNPFPTLEEIAEDLPAYFPPDLVTPAIFNSFCQACYSGLTDAVYYTNSQFGTPEIRFTKATDKGSGFVLPSDSSSITVTVLLLAAYIDGKFDANRIQQTIIHEYGHIVDFGLDLTDTDEEFRKLIDDGSIKHDFTSWLNQGSSDKYEEAFADFFTKLVMTNSAAAVTSTPEAKQYVEYVIGEITGTTSQQQANTQDILDSLGNEESNETEGKNGVLASRLRRRCKHL